MIGDHGPVPIAAAAVLVLLVRGCYRCAVWCNGGWPVNRSRPDRSGTVTPRAAPPGGFENLADRSTVKRSGYPEGSGERLAAFRELEAAQVEVQMSTSTG
jgi:hypothetical protein